MAKKTDNTTAELRQFYALAEQARDLAPWEWMYESEIFGLDLPGEPNRWYVSVMGSAGEYFAYCFYRGNPGLADFLRMHNERQDNKMFGLSMLYRQNCQHVAFEDRDDASPEQLARLKKLDLSFRGPRQWVTVTDFTPSMQPWPVDDHRATPLYHLLLQAMTVAAGKRARPGWFKAYRKAGQSMPIFKARPEGDGFQWEEHRENVDPGPAHHPMGPCLEVAYPEAWTALRAKRAVSAPAALGQAYVVTSVQERKGHRPFYATILVVAELDEGRIIHTALAQTGRHAELEQHLLKFFEYQDWRPRQLQIADPSLREVVGPYFELADIRLRVTKAATEVMIDINEFFLEQGF